VQVIFMLPVVPLPLAMLTKTIPLTRKGIYSAPLLTTPLGALLCNTVETWKLKTDFLKVGA
jgi:hypothetical protein